MKEENYGKGVDVGDGYELVPWDELSTMPKENGDIEYLDGGEWVQFDVRYQLPISYTERSDFVFRRRKAQPANQWRKFSEEKPKNNEVIWGAYDSTGEVQYYGAFWDTRYGQKYTHWKPVEIPQPPAPEKEAWEVAYEKDTPKYGWDNHRAIYCAGFNAGRASR